MVVAVNLVGRPHRSVPGDAPPSSRRTLTPRGPGNRSGPGPPGPRTPARIRSTAKNPKDSVARTLREDLLRAALLEVSLLQPRYLLRRRSEARLLPLPRLIPRGRGAAPTGRGQGRRES